MREACISSFWRLAACACLLLSVACTTVPTPAPTATPLPPTPIPLTATPQVFRSGAIAEIEAYLDELARYNEFAGVVLIGYQGKVIFGKGYGYADPAQKIPNTLQTRFRLGALTWGFTTAAILLLESQGKLNLQDPVCKYVPDCPEAWKDITVYHLLSNSSGIAGYSTWMIKVLPATPEQLIASFRDEPLVFSPPGQRWEYNGSNYILLGYIIEQISGLSYADFLQRNIFTPLNLRNTGYILNATGLAIGYAEGIFSVPQPDASAAYSYVGLYSSAEDLYLWDQALHSDNPVTRAYSGKIFAPQFPNFSWFRGLFDIHGHFAQNEASEDPGFKTLLYTFPEAQVTLIRLSNQGDQEPSIIEPIMTMLFGAE